MGKSTYLGEQGVEHGRLVRRRQCTRALFLGRRRGRGGIGLVIVRGVVGRRAGVVRGESADALRHGLLFLGVVLSAAGGVAGLGLWLGVLGRS